MFTLTRILFIQSSSLDRSFPLRLNSKPFPPEFYWYKRASGNVGSMREPLDGSLWYWIIIIERKMAPVLNITWGLVICSIFVECRKDKVFCKMRDWSQG